MSTITQPKLHQFIPLARNRVVQVPMALHGVPQSLPEYSRAVIPAGATQHTFMLDTQPSRVDDIFLVDSDNDFMVMPNREAPTEGPNRTTLFRNEAYDYNPATRTITFHRPLEKEMQMHWYCMKRARDFGMSWFPVSVKDMLIQGANYTDDILMPPDVAGISGKFQGGCRCFTEIVSLTTVGCVRKSDDLLGFAYRPRMGFVGMDSMEYRIYNSWGQVSDTYCFTFQMK